MPTEKETHMQVGLHQPVVSKERFNPACNGGLTQGHVDQSLQETCASYGIQTSKHKHGKKKVKRVFWMKQVYIAFRWGAYLAYTVSLYIYIYTCTHICTCTSLYIYIHMCLVLISHSYPHYIQMKWSIICYIPVIFKSRFWGKSTARARSEFWRHFGWEERAWTWAPASVESWNPGKLL